MGALFVLAPAGVVFAQAQPQQPECPAECKPAPKKKKAPTKKKAPAEQPPPRQPPPGEAAPPEEQQVPPAQQQPEEVMPQEQEQPLPPAGSETTPLEPIPPEEQARPKPLLVPRGLGVSVGGGVMNFFDGDMRDFVDVAGTWEARVVYGTRSLFAGEVAYVGTAQNVSALGLDSSADLISNGGEAVARVNGMFLADYFRPYAFAGIGFTRYSVVNEDFNNSNVQNGQTVGEFPLGLGAGFVWRRFLFDLRGTIRPAFGGSLVELGPGVNNPNMANWNITGHLGFEF